MIRFTAMQEFLAELLGTMVLIVFGCGVVATVVVFSNPDAPALSAFGGYTNITLGWGFAVLMEILISSGVSGAHLNPPL